MSGLEQEEPGSAAGHKEPAGEDGDGQPRIAEHVLDPHRRSVSRGGAELASILVAHNHPSDPTPSPEDVAVTRALVEAGKLLDIEVLDHVIIGRSGYSSLKAKGLGFPGGDRP
jgi:hypothetical protein